MQRGGRRVGRAAGRAPARDVRRRGALARSSGTPCSSASGTASAGVDDLGLAAPKRVVAVDVAGESVLRDQRRGRQPARGVQRLPAPRLPAVPTRAAGARRGVAALPLPLVDLRASTARCSRRRTRPSTTRRVRAAPGRGRDVAGVRLRAPHAGVAPSRWPTQVEHAGGTLANYGIGDLVTGQVLRYDVRGQLQGAARELQRVLPLRPGAPRAVAAGAVVRRRGRRTSTGTTASRTARAPGRSP